MQSTPMAARRRLRLRSRDTYREELGLSFLLSKSDLLQELVDTYRPGEGGHDLLDCQKCPLPMSVRYTYSDEDHYRHYGVLLPEHGHEAEEDMTFLAPLERIKSLPYY